MTAETWKDIRGLEGRYRVSSAGRVYSIRRDLILAGGRASAGYVTVVLPIPGGRMSRTIHRLVAEAFIPNPLGKRTVNHINGVRHDNRLENLEWATHGENHQHAYDRLGRVRVEKPRRADSPCAKRVCCVDENVGFFGDYPSMKDAAARFGRSYSAIGQAIRKGNRAAGLTWAYVVA